MVGVSWPALYIMERISIKTPNPKCRLFLKIYQYTYLAAGPYPCTYSHREGGGGYIFVYEPCRDAVRGALVHKRGSKYQHDLPYVSPLYKLYLNTREDDI